MTLILSGTDNSATTPAMTGGTAGTSTGPYFPATNQWAVATNGTRAILVDASGNVGIGTSSPGVKLDVTGSIRASVNVTSAADFIGGGAAGYAALYADGAGGIVICRGSSSTNNVEFYTNSAERMRLDTVGRLMIGTTVARSSSSKLELKSSASTALSIYMFKDTQVEVNMGFAGGGDSNFYINSGSTTIGASGVYLTNNGSSWNSVSDERMKTIVEPILDAVQKVMMLRAVIGSYKNDKNNTRRPFLIAQDVQAVLPEAVNVQDQETGTLGMSYTDTIPLLVAAIKEQQVLITALTARVAELEKNL